jgi:hypothetical protein
MSEVALTEKIKAEKRRKRKFSEEQRGLMHTED